MISIEQEYKDFEKTLPISEEQLDEDLFQADLRVAIDEELGW